MNDPIQYNEVDFEENPYDFFTFLLYKGEPFTGVLRDENLVIEFKDGNANGPAIEYDEKGQILSQEVYEDGIGVQEKTWHPNRSVSKTASQLMSRIGSQADQDIGNNFSYHIEN